MNLIPRRQLAPKGLFSDLVDIQSQMNDLFDLSLGRWQDKDKGVWGTLWAPAVDVLDGKDHITVKADLPGLTKEEIEITVHDGVLTLKGEKKEESERKEKGILRSERFYGAFYREVALPSSADTNGIKAAHRNGVLEITIPKKEEAKPKQIKVDVA